jgi:hypothetical protein
MEVPVMRVVTSPLSDRRSDTTQVPGARMSTSAP